VKELTILHISDNNIDDRTTDSIQNLTQLISLDLGNNKLTKTPKGLEKLQKLQYLRLTGNNLNATEISKLKSQLPHTIIAY
jgi:Leucine-rich repeat (LRR) protein